MFKFISALALVVFFTASPSECRRLFRIDTGDDHFSMEKNTGNGFEWLMKEDGRNSFRFLAGDFGSTMSFSMSMDYKIDPFLPVSAVPTWSTSGPTAHTSNSGTSIRSGSPSSVQTASDSKNPSKGNPRFSPTGNPTPTPTTKTTSEEKNPLKLESAPSKNTRRRTTFVGTFVVVGSMVCLVAMSFFILRARRLGRTSITHSRSYTDVSEAASK